MWFAARYFSRYLFFILLLTFVFLHIGAYSFHIYPPPGAVPTRVRNVLPGQRGGSCTGASIAQRAGRLGTPNGPRVAGARAAKVAASIGRPRLPRSATQLDAAASGRGRFVSTVHLLAQITQYLIDTSLDPLHHAEPQYVSIQSLRASRCKQCSQYDGCGPQPVAQVEMKEILLQHPVAP